MSEVDSAAIEAAHFPVHAVAAIASGDLLALYPDRLHDVRELASFLVGREVGWGQVRLLTPHLSTAVLGQFASSADTLPGIRDQVGMMGWLSAQPEYTGDDTANIPLRPIENVETLLADIEVQQANEIVRDSLVAVFLGYTLMAKSIEGNILVTSPTYQNAGEPGFRPFNGGKASSHEMQAELNRVIAEYQEMGVELGLENEESLRKLLIQLGLGIDCSNFIYRYSLLSHQQLGLASYDSTIFWPSDKVREFYEAGKWQSRDKDGTVRALTNRQLAFLNANNAVSVAWIRDAFGRNNSVGIVGAEHLCSDGATVPVQPQDIMPGDLVRFDQPNTGRTGHVAAIVSAIHTDHGVELTIYHSWHTRDLDAGLREDRLLIAADGRILSSSHPGLIDPARYSSITVRRQKSIDNHYWAIKAQAA